MPVGWLTASLYPAFFTIRIVFAVCDDEVIEEKDAHQLACVFYAFGDTVIVVTWADVVAWMIVA